MEVFGQATKPLIGDEVVVGGAKYYFIENIFNLDKYEDRGDDNGYDRAYDVPTQRF
jgi:hypothetical protein